MPSSVRDWRLLLPLLLGGCSAAVAEAPARDPFAVTASGRIDTRDEARYLVAERDARIAEVLVRPGDRVVAGQALLRLACDEVAGDAAAARATAAEAAARARLVIAGPRRETRAQVAARRDAAAALLADARDALARAQGLQASGFVTNRRLAALAADVAVRSAAAMEAEAALAETDHGARPDERSAAMAMATGAEARVAALSGRLAMCTLRSPVAGQILKLLRREGEFSGSSTGTPLIVVGDMAHLIVRAELADRDAAGVRMGQPATIWIDGDRRQWPGRVVETSLLMGRKTARSLDPSDRFDRDVREVLVAFDGPPPPLVVGLRVNIGLPG